MLGELAAVNAALRPLGAGTAGIETVFFVLVLVLAGRVYGPGFGFGLGCTSLFASALITGGVEPWMPYQMFGCAFVGMLAGFLPRPAGRREVLLLAVYGSLSGYLFGFLLNLSFWPFSLDPNSSIAYLPGLPVTEQWHRYVAFDLATSLRWDPGRAVTNFVCSDVVDAGTAADSTQGLLRNVVQPVRPARSASSRAVSSRTADLSGRGLVAARHGPLDWAEPTPVAVGTLLGHLIRGLNRVDLTEDQRRRAEDLVPDLLYPVPKLLIKVPRPADERVRAVADALLADPADRRSLEAHAQAVGVAGRTLMRLFADGTGMSFARWRTCVRLQAALPLLVEARSVSRVARDVGYATPSAFLAVFRRVVGTSPGRCLNGEA